MRKTYLPAEKQRDKSIFKFTKTRRQDCKKIIEKNRQKGELREKGRNR